ncbi:MAG TPA: phenylalanine--tRNA ligase subunit beta, partial [Ferruginibacter sp.]|nr:phenylalanine--tRNA ligase subunit beta [Ferruginibacter sp.]
KFGQVNSNWLKRFDIKSPVFGIDLQLDTLLQLAQNKLTYREISKFPAVNRDLALVVDKNVSYSSLEQVALATRIRQLQSITLFDVFESDKLGAGKKSLAVNFVFLDEGKTLTDPEIDGFMQKIILACEKEIQAEIRK